MRLLPKTYCRSHDAHASSTRHMAGAAGFVNNRTQKTAVNPLTRIASRSVMRPSYSVAAR